jgi:hypothetical protein
VILKRVIFEIRVTPVAVLMDGHNCVIAAYGQADVVSLWCPRSARRTYMLENVMQRLLDVRGEDLAVLVSQDHAPDTKTALDNILSHDYSSNGFNNYI